MSINGCQLELVCKKKNSSFGPAWYRYVLKWLLLWQNISFHIKMDNFDQKEVNQKPSHKSTLFNINMKWYLTFSDIYRSNMLESKIHHIDLSSNCTWILCIVTTTKLIYIRTFEYSIWLNEIYSNECVQVNVIDIMMSIFDKM